MTNAASGRKGGQVFEGQIASLDDGHLTIQLFFPIEVRGQEVTWINASETAAASLDLRKKA